MKTTISLLCLATLLGTVQNVSAAPSRAEVIFDQNDDVRITIITTDNGDGTVSHELETNQPDFVTIKPELQCILGMCFFDIVLDKNGPYDFSGLRINNRISYGYADFVTPTTAAVNFDLWSVNGLHIAPVVTDVSEFNDGGFLTQSSTQTELNRNFEDDEMIDARVAWRIKNLCDGCEVGYQSLVLLGHKMVAEDEWVVYKNNFVEIDPTYVQAESNTGTPSFFPQGNTFDFYQEGFVGGHYVALSFFAAGDDPLDDGVDLGQFSKLEIAIHGDEGLTIEAFLGRHDFDSGQAFLGDIHTTPQGATLMFDISGANRWDVQHLLWLHIPLWKNTHFNVDTDIAFHIDDLRFKK